MLGYIEAKPFVENPLYGKKRAKCIGELAKQIIPEFDPRGKDWGKYWCKVIDAPLVDLVEGFTKVQHGYIIQNCYGHFSPMGHPDEEFPAVVDPPSSYPESVEIFQYREAFVIFGIEDSDKGRALYGNLKKITELNPACIQFGSGTSWWGLHKNSYVLQIEPDTTKSDEVILVDRKDALYLESLRDRMFEGLRKILTHQSLAD